MRPVSRRCGSCRRPIRLRTPGKSSGVGSAMSWSGSRRVSSSANVSASQTETVPWIPVVKSERPPAANSAAFGANAAVGRLATSCPALTPTSQRSTVSALAWPVTTWVPSGEKATDRMPVRVSCAVNNAIRRGAPSMRSDTFAVPSALPVTRRAPSGLQSSEVTSASCSTTAIRCIPVAASKIRTVAPSAIATDEPSGLHASAPNPRSWPLSSAIVSPELTSMIDAVGSCDDATATRTPSGSSDAAEAPGTTSSSTSCAPLCDVDDADGAAIDGRPGRREPVTVIVERRCHSGTAPACDLVKHLAGPHIPDPGGSVRAGSGEKLAVAAECQSCHWRRRAR